MQQQMNLLEIAESYEENEDFQEGWAQYDDDEQIKNYEDRRGT